jgi:hypothetical protein
VILPFSQLGKSSHARTSFLYTDFPSVTFRAETACVDLAQLAHSTVGITRYFDEVERNAKPDVVGIHGTAWFQSAIRLPM